MKGFMITFNFLRFIFVFENYVCVFQCACGCSIQGGQKRTLDPWELEITGGC